MRQSKASERANKAALIRKQEISQMAENKPSERAAEWFQRPAYAAGNMVRAQGEQIRGDTDDSA